MADQKTTSKKRRRLGKGLHAIVGAQTQDQSEAHNTIHITKIDPASRPLPAQAAKAGDELAGQIIALDLDDIVPGSHQPRTRFDDTSLAMLADSIRAVGVIQPIVVRPAATPGRYELIAGERRWRASKLAGLGTIPAIVRETDERSAAEAALIENVQREDLNPIERAEGLRGLIERFGLTQQEVASRVGLDRSSVTNLLRLLDLEPEIKTMLEAGGLGLGHGKALLSMAPGGPRVDAARLAAEEGWSVRRLESAAKKRERIAPVPPEGGVGVVEMRDLEKRLGEHLGTSVQVRASRGGRGTLVIRFFDLDHFDDLMSRIGYSESSGI